MTHFAKLEKLSRRKIQEFLCRGYSMQRISILFIALALALSGCDRGSTNSSSKSAECPGTPEVEVGDSLTAALPTDAGMHALWDPEAFSDICSIASWEDQVLEDRDIERHIAAGRFVPIYVHSDGAPAIELRVGTSSETAALRPEEERWHVSSSQPYLFVSHGSVTLSGLEYIHGDFEGPLRTLELPSGRWKVKIHYLSAEGEERSSDNMYPPDFLVTLNPEKTQNTYRTSVETFDRPIW